MFELLKNIFGLENLLFLLRKLVKENILLDDGYKECFIFEVDVILNISKIIFDVMKLLVINMLCFEMNIFFFCCV